MPLGLCDWDYKGIPSLKIIIYLKSFFVCPHFSINDIFHTKENTRNFNVRATHFNFDIYNTCTLHSFYFNNWVRWLCCVDRFAPEAIHNPVFRLVGCVLRPIDSEVI